MLYLNKVTLCGRITADPEIKMTSNGNAYVRFNVAINRRGSDDAEFIRCVAWKSTAVFVNKYFKKGSAIYLEGALQNNSYKDERGITHYNTDVVVLGVSFVEPKKTDPEAAPEAFGPDFVADSNEPKFEELKTDDDLPF